MLPGYFGVPRENRHAELPGSHRKRTDRQTIARLAIAAGHQVVLSNSRGPETLADTVAEMGPRASAATSWEAAAAGDIVVVSVPVKAFPDWR